MICTPDQIKGLTLVHYGSSSYDPEKFVPAKNPAYWFPKPAGGGLWTSPENSSWGWKQWCEYGRFHTEELDTSFRLQLHPASKVVMIDSWEDYKKDLKVINVSVAEKERWITLDGSYRIVDFEGMLADGIAAIWLTENGQNVTRFGPRLATFDSLYGWDCESVLILDKEAIIPITDQNQTDDNAINDNMRNIVSDLHTSDNSLR